MTQEKAGVHRPLTVAFAAAPCLAIVCVLGIAVAERTDRNLFAAQPPANLAEGAAMGRGDDVARRLERGEDAFRTYSLRPEVTSAPLLNATPAEAALWSGQLLMIHLLDRGGAIGDSRTRLELACLAVDLDVDGEIVEHLSPGGPPECVPGRARDRVMARTGAAQ